VAEQDAGAAGDLTVLLPAGWVQWSPPGQPYVAGAYEPEPVVQRHSGQVAQHWLVVCRVCGAHDEAYCASGAVRLNIARFAGLHLHGGTF
jgi:hypothetical protein